MKKQSILRQLVKEEIEKVINETEGWRITAEKLIFDA